MDRFLGGEWAGLLQEARSARRIGGPKRKATDAEDTEQRLSEALRLLRPSELSRARQTLTASKLAPGNAATLEELRDPELRPTSLTEEIPEEVFEFVAGSRLVFV